MKDCLIENQENNCKSESTPTTQITINSNISHIDNRQSTLSNQSTKDPTLIKKARIYQLLGILNLSFSGVFVKIMVEKYSLDFPYMFYLSLRFFLLALLCRLDMIYNNHNIESLIYFNSTNLKWVIFRIGIFLLSFLLFPLSMKYLKFGLSTLILVTSPVFQNIIYAIYYNLKLNMKYIYACLICLVGVFIIITQSHKNNLNEPNLERDNILLGIFFSISNSVLIGFIYLSVKIMSSDMNIFNINYITSFWDGVLCFIYVIVKEITTIKYMMDYNFMMLMAVVVLLSYFGFHYINLSIVTADISKSSYIMYLQLPIHGLFGILFYNETYNLVESCGVLIILITSIYTSVFIN